MSKCIVTTSSNLPHMALFRWQKKLHKTKNMFLQSETLKLVVRVCASTTEQQYEFYLAHKSD